VELNPNVVAPIDAALKTLPIVRGKNEYRSILLLSRDFSGNERLKSGPSSM
jgi:hypothetical protein